MGSLEMPMSPKPSSPSSMDSLVNLAEWYTHDDTSSPVVAPLQVSLVVCCLGTRPHPRSYRTGDGDAPYFPLLNRWALGLEKQAHVH